MTYWYDEIAGQGLGRLDDALTHFKNRAQQHQKTLRGMCEGLLERISQRLPGVVEQVWREYQEVEALLKYMESQKRQEQQRHFKRYLENYQRSLSSRDAERYAENESSVVDLENLVMEVALVRNLYQSVMKGFDSLSYQINNITRLRAAGMEDTVLEPIPWI